MPENAPDSSPKAGTPLRIVGVLILLLGLGAAGLVYWMSAPPEDLSDDVLTSGNSKKVERAIEVNVGKMGVMMDGLSEDLQDPATQAIVIAVASILVASGCFTLPACRPATRNPTTPFEAVPQMISKNLNRREQLRVLFSIESFRLNNYPVKSVEYQSTSSPISVKFTNCHSKMKLVNAKLAPPSAWPIKFSSFRSCVGLARRSGALGTT